jgi:urease accessory protein
VTLRVFDRRVPATSQVAGELRLIYEWRQKTRFRMTVSRGTLAGETVGIDLERGTVLREGDHIANEQGTVLLVSAAIEQLLQVEAGDPLHLARIAYHLGNRHVPVQIGTDGGSAWLRLQIDHVLENMVIGLGASVSVVSAAFDPESGAYGHAGHASADGHDHDSVPMHEHSHRIGSASRHDDRRHMPRIHDFLSGDD